jgi:hypothetical protein
VEDAWVWNDKTGENWLILSRMQPYKEKDEYGEEGESVELFIYQFSGKDGVYQPVWSFSEKEVACIFDVTAELVKAATSITDLDEDGLAETTVIYRTACRSDVSPSTMKLLMHEGTATYKLEGASWYGMGDTKFDITEDNANLETLPGYKGIEDELFKTFGRYESEKDFSKAPASFIKHARKHWLNFVKESTD